MGLLDIDPRTQGLLAMGLQGLQLSGPSRTPVSLGQIIGGAGMTGLNEYQQAAELERKRKHDEALMALKQAQMNQEAVKALKEANDAKLDAQMRIELAGAKNAEEQLAIARKYMKADTLGTSITSSLDRQSGQEATKEMAKARLSQSLQTAQNTHDARMRTLTDAKDRAAETARHNSVTEGLQRESLGITGQRLFYDIGLTPEGGLTGAPAPTGGLLGGVPAGFKAQESFSTDGQTITDPAEIAAAKMVMDADQKGQPLTVGVPKSGLLGPVTNAPTSVIQAPPNNLDARDLALRNMMPPAPIAPVAAPPVNVSRSLVPPPEIGAGLPPRARDEEISKWRLQQSQMDKDSFISVVGPNGRARLERKSVAFEKGLEPAAASMGGVLNSQTVRERQLATALERTIKPYHEAMKSYQNFEEIKLTVGDNSQANMFLAQSLVDMARRGTRALPKDELERILGSGDLGNDWIGRAGNMLTQMAAGVRTPTIDKRFSDLADAMARASAKRISQEIQNTRAATPPGMKNENIIGATPRIYGKFIITPTGRIHEFKSADEAQEKLNAAAQLVGQ